jgi:hypothetical protein
MSEEIRKLLVEADSKLSLLRHRGSIKWGEHGLPEAYEVDQVIGRLRKAYEGMETTDNLVPDLSDRDISDIRAKAGQEGLSDSK